MTLESNILVYVIDDDESVRTAFGYLLQSAGYQFQSFSSCDEFLGSERQKENACIVTDIMMPGQTGLHLAQTLASSGIKIPLIIISASDDPEARDLAMSLGAVAFFHKPVDDQALLDTIVWSVSQANRIKHAGLRETER